jgi:hypothetical protein
MNSVVKLITGFSLAASVYGHGYMVIPSSRTSLGHLVSVPYTVLFSDVNH